MSTRPEEVFAEYRPLLFSIAYEILGSVVDTEDVLQESYLRWRDAAVGVEHPRAYLARIVTRQSLNALRSAARRREEYVGTWLPEPLPTTGDEPGDHVLTGEAVSTAMLLVLETLTPTERAVFVLREVFDFGYPEIAEAVGKTPEAVRQIAHRARGHVRARRTVALAEPARARAAAQAFLQAATTGDVQALLDVLAPDAVYLGDGGGRVVAARRPVLGAEAVARMILGLVKMSAGLGEMTVGFAEYNGMPALVIAFDGAVDTVMCIEVTDEGVTAVYAVRNPEKLVGVVVP
ncbi:MAG: RNA polymerase sigma-70 factor [Gordonia sp. (in: high G+C Gram-positive bacteria)]|uniref:RNA polymerase sigma-70 factor n=1 Tax=Gordonia sp. (in: high G+C Gram-positive bacteria) TaxID=84139 RepID=UPI0039E35D0E